MPIVSTIKEVTVNADGSKRVFVRSFDQDGEEKSYSFPMAFSENMDSLIDSLIASRTADLNEQLAQAEFEAMIGSV